MTSRKPPSQRDVTYAPQRVNRALTSMAPGSMGGRVANAAFTKVYVSHVTLDPELNGYFAYDRFIVAATPLHTYQSSRSTHDQTLLVAVNGLVLQESVDYTVNYATGEFTISSTLHAGDVIDTRYVV